MSDRTSRRSRAGTITLAAIVLAVTMLTGALALPGVAGAAPAPAFVQAARFEATSGSAVSASFSKANTAGNLIVVFVVWDNSGAASVTDTHGNTYASALGPTQFTGDRASAQIFYARNVASGANTVTAHFATALAASGAVYVHEYVGADRSAPVEAAVASAGASAAMTSGPLTTRSANTLLFAGAESNKSVTKGGTGYAVRGRAYGNLTEDRSAAAAGSYAASATQSGTAWVLQLVAFRAAGSAPSDTTAPSVPANLTASAVTSTTATMSWSPSTDDTGVAGYRVLRNGSPIATSAQTQYTDTLLTPATAYSYAVAAFDQANNTSAPSPALAVTTAPGTAGPVYPLKVGTTLRSLVDQNGTPVLITGDSPQALMVNLSEAEAEAFFANRQAAGFNLVWINLLCATYTGGRADASTYDGIVPFTTPGDLATPNEAYFARVDAMLRLAGQHGLIVLLDPAETGSFLSMLRANGVAKSREYGRYLGQRYRGADNIIWMSGNDFQSWEDPTDDAPVQAVAQGIREVDDRHLHTVELDYLVSGSLDDPGWAPIIQLNATYTYYPTYAQVLLDYNRPNALPTFLVEANYEFEHNAADLGTPQILRRQAYWALLSGAAGHLYGNRYTWPFIDGWQSNLDTPGSAQMGHVKSLFEARAWYNLIPDQGHTVVKAGYGTFASTGSLGANDYATAARTPDGSLVMAYLPTVRTITVDMSKLGAPAQGWWYDPANGTFLPIAGSPLANTGTRTFRPSGNNSAGDGDWVLVLEAPSAPADGQAPSVPAGLTATAASSSEIALSWGASQDNTAVAGYQIFRDGAPLAATLGTAYTDRGLSPLTSYSYTVAAYDYFHNASAPSAVLHAATTGPAPTFVQQNYAVPQSPQALVGAAYLTAQTAGNTNIIAIGWNDAVASITAVTDGAGNTYHQAIATYRANGLSQAIYYASGIAGATAGSNQVAVAFDRPAVYVDLRIAEYAGLSPTNAFDTGVSAGGTGTSANSGALAAVGSSELLFAAGITSSAFSAAGAGFTARVITSPDGDIVADAVTASAGSYRALATLSSGTWIMQLAAFRAAAASP